MTRARAGAPPGPAALEQRTYIAALYAIAEGNAPDRELLAGIPNQVALIELQP
jgi:hypothetical protein